MNCEKEFLLLGSSLIGLVGIILRSCSVYWHAIYVFLCTQKFQIFYLNTLIVQTENVQS